MADRTVIVGRIAVMVTPDTTGFKEKLEAKLRRIEKSLRKIKVQVEVDDKDLADQVRRAAEQAGDAAKVKLNVDEDHARTQARQAASAVGQELDRVARDIKLFDGDVIEGELIEELDNALDQARIFMKAHPIRAPMELDVGDLGREVIAEREKAQAAAEAEKIKLRINFDYDESIRKGISHLEHELIRMGEEDFPVTLTVEGIEEALDKLHEARKLELKVDPQSARSVERAIRSIDAEMERLREVQIDVSLNEDDLADMREQLADELSGLQSDTPRMEIRFGADETSLRAALREVERELEKLRPANLEIDVDEKSLLASKHTIQRELDALEREAQAIFDFDKAVKDADIKRLAQRIDKQLGNFKIRPGVDRKDFDKGMRSIEQKLWEMSDLEAKLTVDLDERTRRETEHKIKKLKDDIEDIEANIAVDVSSGSYQIVKAQMAWLARTRVVQLVPEVSKTAMAKAATTLAALSGARLTGDIFSRLWDAVKDIDKSAPKIAKMSSIIATLAASVFATTSNVFALAAGLVSMLPLLMTLPGILGGMAIGAIITIRALSDFKKQLPDVVEAVKRLGETISDKFWAQARKPIQEMSNQLLPTLRKEFGLTSTAVGRWFGTFSTAIAKSLLPHLSTMFRSLNDSIGIFEGATEPLASIIAQLGLMGSEELPALAAWMKKLLDQFDDWLAKIRKDGTWKRWVETAKTALHDFGRVFKATFDILSDIAYRAGISGGSGLDVLADTLERIQKVTSGAKFQTGLGRLFAAGHGFFDNFTNMGGAFGDFIYELTKTVEIVLPRIGDTLATLGKSLFNALAEPHVQKAIINFFDGVARGIEGLAPYLPSIVDGLASLAEAMGEFIAAAGPSLGEILSAVAEALKEVAPLLPDLAKEVFPALADAAKTLAPLLADIAKTVLPKLVEIVKDLLPYIEKAVRWFRDFADEHPDLASMAVAIGAVTLALGGFKAVVGGLLAATFKLGWRFVAAPALRSLGRAVAPILARLAQAVGKTGIGRFLTRTFGIKWTFKTSPTAAKSLVGRLLGPIGLALTAIEVGHWLYPFVERMKNWIVDHVPDSVGSALKTAWELAFGPSGPLRGFRIGLEGIWEEVTTGWNRGSEVFKNAVAAFPLWADKVWPDRWPWEDPKPASKINFTEATKSITDFVGGAGVGMKKLGELLSPLGNKFKEAFGELKPATQKALTETGTAVAEKGRELLTKAQTAANGVKNSIISAFTGGKAGVAGAAGTMVSGVLGIVQQTLNPVPNKATEAKGRLANALSAGKGAVSTAASTMVSGVAGSISSKLSGLKSTGSTAIGRFRDGITSMRQYVLNAAGSIASAGKPKVPSMYGSGQSIGSSFAAGIRSMWSTVWNAAGSIAKAASAWFPRSPAEIGPFSGKGWVLYSGYSIGESFADGMLARVGQVRSAAEEIADAARSGLDTFNDKDINLRAPGVVGGLNSSDVAAAAAERVNVTVNNYNPVAEPGSTTVNRNMRRLAMAGMI